MPKRLLVQRSRSNVAGTALVHATSASMWRTLVLASLLLASSLLARPVAGQATEAEQTAAASPGIEPAVADPVPVLIAQLSDGDLQARRDAVWALADLSAASAPAVAVLTEAIDDDDTQVCNGALQALGRIGPAAETAVPKIFAQLRQRDAQRRYRAAYALGRAAQADSPLFLEGLRDPAATVRAATVEAVGWMSEPPEVLVAEAVQLLGDDDAEVGAAAQRTLQKIGTRALPLLVAALGQEQAVAQRRAAETLEWLEMPLDENARQRLLELCASHDAAVHAAALTALAKVASNSPAVTTAVQQALGHDDPVILAAALNSVIALGSLPPASVEQLVKHVDASPEIASLAATALGRLGSTALPAVPWLLQRLTPENQSLIVPAISALGPDAIPAVLRGAADEQLSVSQAAEIIGRIGPTATVSLEQALTNQAATDRAVAAEALGRVRVEPATTDLLLPLLADDAGIVRAAAAAGLAQLGPLARHAQPQLRQHMEDPEPAVRAQCLTALVATGAEAEEVTPAIVRGLQDDSPEVRRQSAVALGNLDEVSVEAQTALITALKDSDALVRQRAAETLGRRQETAEPAAGALVETLQDADAAVSLSAAQALTRVERLDESAVVALLPLLGHPSVELRRTAIAALAAGGDAARQSADRLAPFQKDEASEVRAAALRTLAALAEDDEARLNVLLNGLDDSDWTVRRDILETLGDLGERAAGAVPRLLTLMRDPEDGESASAALRRIDAAPPEAIPLLLEILQDSDSNRRHRFYALHLLRKTGPAAQQALPVLRQLRDESQERIREFYERAIRDIEGGDADD